jgi:hypothetical protein
MKIRSLDLSANEINLEHDAFGLPPIEEDVSHPAVHPFLNVAAGFTSVLLVGFAIFLMGRLFYPDNWSGGLRTVNDALAGHHFWGAAAVGFVAQAIDGALGMAYGITATTFLLSAGFTPAVASASVHIAEIFTTGFSGVSHVKLGNVDKSLFLRLLGPGILGAIIGTVLVTQIDGKVLKPFISGYLVLMGIYILIKALRYFKPPAQAPRHAGKLALFGAFVDTVGGGGWGPVVTTTLIGSGSNPRLTIGSVNFAEFFIAVTSAASFSFLVPTSPWVLVAGLAFGGFFAAPFAAMLCKALHARLMLSLVGTLIVAISLFNLYKAVLA